MRGNSGCIAVPLRKISSLLYEGSRLKPLSRPWSPFENMDVEKLLVSKEKQMGET